MADWGQPVWVTAQNDWFNIREGEGERQVTQSFKVLSVEVLPDTGCR
jgi:hypothetical protein